MDGIDRRLLDALQRDALQPYAELGEIAGLAAGSAHERVRKLRDRHVIRRTTIDVDPAAVGRPTLAYLLVEADAWLGDPASARAFAAIDDIVEAHVVAGGVAVLLKVRTESTYALQSVLRSVYAIGGVTGVQTIVVLDTFVERPVNVAAPA